MAREIPLTRGLVAIVDDTDYDILSKFKWCAHRAGNTYYAVRQENNRFVYMHIQILGRRPGLEIDHIDGNGLNNRRSNLRFVTHRQNQQNRRYRRYSKYPGVSWDKVNRKWVAYIYVDGKQRWLGRFNKETEAFRAYCLALAKMGFELPDIGKSFLQA